MPTHFVIDGIKAQQRMVLFTPSKGTERRKGREGNEGNGKERTID
jgi:hypothetical protein